MNLKRFSLVVALVLVLGILLTADKKEQPIPLEELKNPKSPSYVPIPYPQTREEIIVDVEYIIKDTACYKIGVRSYDENVNDIDKILLKLVEKDTGYYIGRIVKVYNKTNSRPDYYFTMDIHDKSGKLVARMSIKDTGLFSAFSILSPELKTKPFMTLAEVKNFFANSSIGKLKNATVESIEFENYQSPGPHCPILKITTRNGIFYMDTFDNGIFEVHSVEKFSSFRKFIIKKSREYTAQDIDVPFDRALVNTLDNDVKYIKRVD